MISDKHHALIRIKLETSSPLKGYFPPKWKINFRRGCLKGKQRSLGFILSLLMVFWFVKFWLKVQGKNCEMAGPST